MKAITIKQPWASLIVHGIKDVENRSWKTNYRGRIYIHAGSDKNVFPRIRLLSNEQLSICVEKCEIVELEEADDSSFSAIIGEVDIIECVKGHSSIWAEEGVYNWVLANPVRYDHPILNVKGKQSFWNYEG